MDWWGKQTLSMQMRLMHKALLWLSDQTTNTQWRVYPCLVYANWDAETNTYRHMRASLRSFAAWSDTTQKQQYTCMVCIPGQPASHFVVLMCAWRGATLHATLWDPNELTRITERSRYWGLLLQIATYLQATASTFETQPLGNAKFAVENQAAFSSSLRHYAYDWGGQWQWGICTLICFAFMFQFVQREDAVPTPDPMSNAVWECQSMPALCHTTIGGAVSIARYLGNDEDSPVVWLYDHASDLDACALRMLAAWECCSMGEWRSTTATYRVTLQYCLGWPNKLSDLMWYSVQHWQHKGKHFGRSMQPSQYQCFIDILQHVDAHNNRVVAFAVTKFHTTDANMGWYSASHLASVL
jgi:hypothetical protein